MLDSVPVTRAVSSRDADTVVKDVDAFVGPDTVAVLFLKCARASVVPFCTCNFSYALNDVVHPTQALETGVDDVVGVSRPPSPRKMYCATSVVLEVSADDVPTPLMRERRVERMSP